MTYVPILAGEVDAESPIDDKLTQKIADNFADHESRIQLLKSFALGWNLNGDLSALSLYLGKYKRLDGVRLVQPQTLTQATLLLERPGLAGTLEIDIRKYRALAHSVISMVPTFTGSINTIARAGTSLSTQSIARASSTIATQSIALFKAALNVASVVVLPNGYARINFSGNVDSDWKPGNTVTFASMTSGANNGSFLINRIMEDGASNNIVIANGSAVVQTSAAGTGTLRAYVYNYTNPVSTTDYIPGEACTFASHSNAASDGIKVIYAVNSGGNNIVVKDSAGVVQAGVAGNAGCSHWVYAYSSPVATTDYAVGEMAEMASHSNANNNGNTRILAINSGGNNLVVYNEVGVAQGSAAGTANACRWTYALSADPTSFFTIGDNAVAQGTTSGFNTGTFVVKQINRGGTNNLVIYNVGGLAQGSALGAMFNPKIIVSFAADQSAFYTTRSNVEIVNHPYSNNCGFFDVLEINRGGGSNYNIVIYNELITSYALPSGRVVSESKSVFSTTPKIVVSSDQTNSDNNAYLSVQTVAPVFHVTDATITNAETAANVGLGLEILQRPSGNPINLTVQVA